MYFTSSHTRAIFSFTMIFLCLISSITAETKHDVLTLCEISWQIYPWKYRYAYSTSGVSCRSKTFQKKNSKHRPHVFRIFQFLPTFLFRLYLIPTHFWWKLRSFLSPEWKHLKTQRNRMSLDAHFSEGFENDDVNRWDLQTTHPKSTLNRMSKKKWTLFISYIVGIWVT